MARKPPLVSEVGPAPAMAITYYKRYRMEIDLGGVSPPALPSPYTWKPWDDSLVEAHAEVKYLCFRDEIDAQVFPCLGDLAGCRRLMREIRRKPGFLPPATWLIAAPAGFVATIQGVIDREGVGAIQNVGVLPAYRGRGLGRRLVCRALMGFRERGVGRAFLEVTAENVHAVRLYRSLGFRRVKTLYKAVDG
ncbi:GNAT family N-acetyltransferase [Tautonia plasticadhaerens]|uniref:Ribosomal-protein-alanine N-acetyltransferase n=1 Tax=Tautonia plasticadhaerens TaxID=2527974 RepID=A0A518H024_9BACT|nr:N-acetyltransferase [Tautonia plasticadhaerens]QDV34183.1 ribosomal-protein-alanine N-acetyltransferase [Tautonia plasticadhaerens]